MEQLCEKDGVLIVRDGGRYGLIDKGGNILLPLRYDNIFAVYRSREGVGFVLCRDARFGYMEFGEREHLAEDEYSVVLGAPNGCARAFLPCVYPRVEVCRNGLRLYPEEGDDGQELWFDFRSRVLHRDLRWLQGFGDFDSFLLQGEGMPILKRAGEDAFVKLPEDCGMDPWAEIPLGEPGVRCILCLRELGEGDFLYEYFFLLLFKDGWMPTPAKRDLSELYAELPAMIEGISNRKKRKDETEKKQVYSLLCKYKRKREEWE